MIPVLIVDDEAPIRQALADMLSRHYPGCFDIAQAENGKRALEQAANRPVSLMLADIKMPTLSGLDMLTQLKEIGFPGEVIFISGFDDYELVRQAMKLGATDYLLKPIVEADFYAQLDQFLLREKRRAPRPESGVTPRQLAYRQQYLLEQLMRGELPAQLLQENRLDAQQPCIACVVDAPAGTPCEAALESWKARLAGLTEQGCVLLQGEWQKQPVLLFCFQKRASERAFAEVQWPDAQTRLMCSPPLPLQRAREGWDACQRLILDAFYNLRPQDGPERYPYGDLISRMTQAMCALSADEFSETLSLLAARACAQRPPREALRQLMSAMIFSVMQRNSAYIRPIAEHELTDDDALHCIQSAPSMAALCAGLTRIVRLLMAEAEQAGGTQRYGELAKEYVRAHFREELPLAEVAEHLGIHPNYFSSLFKKQEGISYSRYVRRVRIAEACGLMRGTNRKLYEIADSVGYHDPVQFNRAFREEMGCSPSEYQKGGGRSAP